MRPIKTIFKQKQNFIFRLSFSVMHFIELQIMMRRLGKSPSYKEYLSKIIIIYSECIYFIISLHLFLLELQLHVLK